MTPRTALVICAVLCVVVATPRPSFGQVALSAGRARTTVIVDARHPWVDSGLTVQKGDRLVFEADGTIRGRPISSDPLAVARILPPPVRGQLSDSAIDAVIRKRAVARFKRTIK